MPKGYWIARVNVADMEQYKAYIDANAKPFRLFGAKFLPASIKQTSVLHFRHRVTALHQSSAYVGLSPGF